MISDVTHPQDGHDTYPNPKEESSPSKSPDTSDHPTTSEAPDGGLQAWIVAAGGSAIFFCCLGFSNSFGTFEQYYLSHQLLGEFPDRVAWIGSLSAFLQFAAGMVGGRMFDRVGAWVILMFSIPGVLRE